MNENVQGRGLASRRTFLKSSAAVVAAGAATASLPLAVYAAGSDLLRIGLIGCGGRGTGAAGQALHADKNVKLVAMAGALAHRMPKRLTTIQTDPELDSQIHLPEGRRMLGI